MPVSYPKSLGDDLKILSQIDEKTYQSVLTLLNEIEDNTIRPSVLRERLGKIVSENEADRLVRVSLSICKALSAKSTIELPNLLNEIASDIGIDVNLIMPLEDIINSPAIKVTAKAYFLSYDHSQIFSSVSSVVDVRPIFNEDKSIIVGTVIVPTIKLKYFDNNTDTRKELSLALDEDDVKQIADALSEIIGKIKLTKKAQIEPTPLTSFTAGEESL